MSEEQPRDYGERTERRANKHYRPSITGTRFWDRVKRWLIAGGAVTVPFLFYAEKVEVNVDLRECQVKEQQK